MNELQEADEASALGGVAIKAYGLGLKSPRITAYQGVDLEFAPAQAHAVLAENKAGKTELLLTLAGRMRATSGELTVAGFNGRTLTGLRHIRALSGLGWFENVNELEKVLNVRTCISAELGLVGKRSGKGPVASYLAEWGLTEVAKSDLESLDRYTFDLVGIALGMAGDPQLLALDEIETDLTEHQTMKLIDLLKTLARERGVTVVCGMCDYDLARHFDSVACITEDARAQRDAVLRRDATAIQREVA